ncbi:vWA domain-containing protein [Amycolatopsis alba]|uniref:VWA domain-containing protein n=1 Tax=Amycolatopsis alba DSM 44262 TaxID=1125972 RepID=A0A229RKE1_AMYAL|nr:vWA domain-containing protein [Amycolatopsis alba]OXM47045.1 VWA domain-containing protein [Amycolatopsis alba DSM 44262]
MSGWVRKRFEGAGLTQSPPGPHFGILQAKYRGTVLLCIDVSGSMRGSPLRQAVDGGIAFLDEAFDAKYDCGLVLWNHDVEAYVRPGSSRAELTNRLEAAVSTGGNNLLPTLRIAKEDLAPLTGDRVLCVFGDGDVGKRGPAVGAARELCALGVRIVVRGLGHGATKALSALVCPGQQDEDRLIEDVRSISAGIASMAKGLTVSRKSGGRR